MKYLLFALTLVSLSFCIVTGQQDSPQPRVLSCEGHRQLDQVFYDVQFVNDGGVSSNFHIGDTYSKNIEPGQEGTITVSYPLPLEQHTHSAEIQLCVGGYLSFERCVSHTCSYSDGPAPESSEDLLSTEKLEGVCLPAFILLGLLGGFLKNL
ncbi:hypothetical protein GF412_01585 [Candidatus Micrarchaeota archaeon]|nr:hypothetical protein [Candidatus Micrarchaeota archaeon]MBD3417658.1 hypothetical protein [Candidatus Micrarchaeota archaeon]